MIKPTGQLLKQFASSVFTHTDDKGNMFATSSGEDYRYGRYRSTPEEDAKKIPGVEVPPQVFYGEFIIAGARNNSYGNEISKLRLDDSNFQGIYYVMSMANVMQLFFTEGVSIDDEGIIKMEFVFQKRGGTVFVCPFSSKVKKQIADEELRQSQMGSGYKPGDIVIDGGRKYAYLGKGDVECKSEWDTYPVSSGRAGKSNNNEIIKQSHIFINMDCEATYPYTTRFCGYKSKPRRQITGEQLSQNRLFEMIAFLNSTVEHKQLYWQTREVKEITTYPITTTLSIPGILQIK